MKRLFAPLNNLLRINLYQGPNGSPVIEPGSGVQRHSNTAMRTPLPAKFRIIVPAIGSRAIHAVPPGVVQEKTSRSPLQGIIDVGRRVPVGRAIRPLGGKRRRMELQKNVVRTRWC